MDFLVEQSSQGQFTQEGRQDILVTAIGRLEHLGWVRAAGTIISIRQFFGSSSRPSSYELSQEHEQRLKQDITKEIMQEITKKVTVELYDEVAEMVEVTKEVAQLSVSYRPCQLYILHPTRTMLVARGTVYKATTIVHGMELGENVVKVMIDEVVVPNVFVP
ncbi:hypothetical protein LR48_Vigan06g085800 [Vigna angularis]|uniref:DUF8039 domain-containing protein n=1 Tax=Phaseolus angularis TaxID=3914 RepID=A0A0L9USK4_PHAAN|nr:hypothetical protein LR48_Vigan06g085800 [Vigna angularis]